MKHKIKKFKVPRFLEDPRLRTIAGILLTLTLVSLIFATMLNWVVGLILIVLLIGTLITILVAIETVTENTDQYISDLSYRIKRGEQEALVKMPIGILLYNDQQEVQWANPFLQKYLGDKAILGKPLTEVDSELANLITQNQDDHDIKQVHWGDNQFQIIIQHDIGVVYLLDITRYAAIEDRYEDEQLAMGQVFLDNYDEITQTMDDTNISNLNNYVTNALSKWADDNQMFLKQVGSDRFLLLAYTKSLHQLEKNRFKILDEIREVTSKQNFPLTLSIGFAYGDVDLAQLSTISQSNLDLALGRGGDQVVVKSSKEQARFYGGRTNPMEKRTRVRARMISAAMREIFKQVDDIYVVGHRQPDMDALGAAIGIRRIAKMNQKRCYIVVDEANTHTDLRRTLAQMHEEEEVSSDLINSQQALSQAGEHSLLVMVDHSKPSLTMSEALYEKLANRLVIVDHHRRGEEFPDNPMLVYIEPYASSTCELVTEMFEYQPQRVANIQKFEATIMLAGITVDTKSFSMNTGTRTFDAASYLRSVGANSSMMQHLLKEDVGDYIQKNHLIQNLEMIEPNIAVCVGETNISYDPVLAAQAADTLLSLSGIEAAFVIIKRQDDVVAISARSLGQINVQMIMEQLGGGGHLSNAATQMPDTTTTEAKAKLLAILAKEIEP